MWDCESFYKTSLRVLDFVRLFRTCVYDCFSLQPFESTALEDSSRVQFESTVWKYSLRVQFESTVRENSLRVQFESTVWEYSLRIHWLHWEHATYGCWPGFRSILLFCSLPLDILLLDNCFLLLGNSSFRGRSPVEWGDFLTMSAALHLVIVLFASRFLPFAYCFLGFLPSYFLLLFQGQGPQTRAPGTGPQTRAPSLQARAPRLGP